MKCCLDCSKEISKNSLRCKSCSNKFRTGKYKCDNSKKLSEKNPMWRGDNVGLSALHMWILKRKEKPQFCVRCNKNKPYDLANISGNYKRDVNDFEWLCRGCHMRMDKRINNLRQYNG